MILIFDLGIFGGEFKYDKGNFNHFEIEITLKRTYEEKEKRKKKTSFFS